jgi:hypothetical protein
LIQLQVTWTSLPPPTRHIMTWKERKDQLRSLLSLKSPDEDEEGRAIDTIVLLRATQQSKSALHDALRPYINILCRLDIQD